MAVRSAIKRKKKKKTDWFEVSNVAQLLCENCVRTMKKNQYWEIVFVNVQSTDTPVFTSKEPRETKRNRLLLYSQVRHCSVVIYWSTLTVLHRTSEWPHTLLPRSYFIFFFFLLTLTLSRTPMPFRLVSPVSNADMNLPGDKGPNYSRGLIVHRLTVSNCPPSVKPGTENV